MKKRIHIPNQRRYLPQKHRPAPPKPQVERVRVGSLPGIDHGWVARRVNLAFILADIQQTLAMEVEDHLRRATGDPSIDLAHMRYSLDRIRAHADYLVSFVDKNTPYRFAEQFGEKADEIKEQLYKQFGIEQINNQ